MAGPEPAATPWWNPDRFADRRPFLKVRSAVSDAVRRFFRARDFIEVETAILQVSPGNETHLHAPRTTIRDQDGQVLERYLRTSPEFAAKKLLAAGEPRIFELARVFRDRESGPLHLSEFTMLEWYRAREPYETIIDDACKVVHIAAEAAETMRFSFRGKTADLGKPVERVTVADAFARFAGVDLLATIDGSIGNRDALAHAAKSSIRIADDDTWSDIFSKVLTEHVEPRLGQGQLTVLYEYPAPESALARAKPGEPRVAERFELYACGVELANGFGELTDAVEQRARFDESMNEKQRRYGERYPIDDDFISAVAAMPSASGVAMGFDRLVMLAAGASRVDQVVWTPAEVRQ